MLVIFTILTAMLIGSDKEEHYQMKKLYFPPEQPQKYWEYWGNDDASYTVHWGELGTEGEQKNVSGWFLNSAVSKVRKMEQSYLNEGYAEIDPDDQVVLLVEYLVEGFGVEQDLEKRHALEDLMNEVLGWTGLGHCDGGSIGSGSMEVACFVVDFELAKSVISKRLRDTHFADYSRIFREG